MTDNRNAIDFSRQPIGKLFRKMFLPTLLSMVSMVILNITDGAFVGHGAGSDALAAINIVVPIFGINHGLALMFGIGSSVVASIHLAKGDQKAANINLTQGVLATALIGLVLGSLFFLFQEETCLFFGSSQQLLPLACSYLKWMALLTPFNMFSMVAMFMIRLDGSPKYAMSIYTGIALLNIVLDYLLVFPFHMGLEGAAIATFTAFSLGNIPVLLYLLKYRRTTHFHRLKATKTSLQLTLRNIGYQMKLGASALLGEIAISSVIVIGNYVFISYLGEDGVAAFSVGCYCLPIVFMMGNAIVQSVQPIISFAYGANNTERLLGARNIALRTAGITGALGMAFLWIGAPLISATFLPTGCHAYQLCREGLPWFSIAFLFVAINLVCIGYYQSIEQAVKATIYTLLRGFIFSIPSFLLLPQLIAPKQGLWLALPLAEALTTILILYVYVNNKLHLNPNRK